MKKKEQQPRAPQQPIQLRITKQLEPKSGSAQFERPEIQAAYDRGESIIKIGQSDWMTREELKGGTPKDEKQRLAQEQFKLVQEAGTKMLFDQYMDSMAKRLMEQTPEELGIDHYLTEREAKLCILRYIETIGPAQFQKDFEKFWEYKAPAEPAKRRRKRPGASGDKS